VDFEGLIVQTGGIAAEGEVTQPTIETPSGGAVHGNNVAIENDPSTLGIWTDETSTLTAEMMTEDLIETARIGKAVILVDETSLPARTQDSRPILAMADSLAQQHLKVRGLPRLQQPSISALQPASSGKNLIHLDDHRYPWSLTQRTLAMRGQISSQVAWKHPVSSTPARI
jgi:hypothetical protein